mmetsp:Transcript_24324/g.21586  ORF Transcript_24324/g.21586 Transcript_24324/m.21586 type:complete len:136 (+) Transcript_24324:292-699(+)
MNKAVKILSLTETINSTELSHPKQVNFCLPYKYDNTKNEYNKLATCSRDGIVRLFNLNSMDATFDSLSPVTLKGHHLSVTSAAINPDSTILASGGRDYNTFIWDLETNQQISQCEIERNMVTYMKWIPNSQTFVQ